jgi:hypothetical protein
MNPKAQQSRRLGDDYQSFNFLMATNYRFSSTYSINVTSVVLSMTGIVGDIEFG